MDLRILRFEFHDNAIQQVRLHDLELAIYKNSILAQNNLK